MNTPGFLAEAALQQTTGYYSFGRDVSAFSGDTARQIRVVASLMRGCTSICKCCESHGSDYCCKTCWESCPE